MGSHRHAAAHVDHNQAQGLIGKRSNEGDTLAAESKQAFLLQVAKDIGSMACVLNGKVDQIIVTGGIAYGADVVNALKERAAALSHRWRKWR
mgnify:CR=1 FL=1